MPEMGSTGVSVISITQVVLYAAYLCLGRCCAQASPKTPRPIAH